MLFGRVRAYSSGRVRFRSHYAAELALQGTVYSMMGVLVGALIFWLCTVLDLEAKGRLLPCNARGVLPRPKLVHSHRR
jgi:hypothetical protein